MGFRIIQMDSWKRKEYFEHFFLDVTCTYSMTVQLDITGLKNSGDKIYPAMLYNLATVISRHEEFRTGFDESGRLGVYDVIHPCYTVFHKESETFSSIWTEFSKDRESFFEAYERDISLYGSFEGILAKPESPRNTFPVSMIPWESFEGFNLNLQKGYDFLSPIFTMGKYWSDGNGYFMPLAIQVHHAVCDGFHVCRFVDELRELTAEP